MPTERGALCFQAAVAVHPRHRAHERHTRLPLSVTHVRERRRAETRKRQEARQRVVGAALGREDMRQARGLVRTSEGNSDVGLAPGNVGELDVARGGEVVKERTEI